MAKLSLKLRSIRFLNLCFELYEDFLCVPVPGPASQYNAKTCFEQFQRHAVSEDLNSAGQHLLPLPSTLWPQLPQTQL